MTVREPRRKDLRLPTYDYTRPGAYFVTLCTHERACLFGTIANGEIALSQAGEVARRVLEGLPGHYPGLELDEWVIMPNHIHFIVWITEPPQSGVGEGLRPALPTGESSIPIDRPAGGSNRAGLRPAPTAVDSTIGDNVGAGLRPALPSGESLLPTEQPAGETSRAGLRPAPTGWKPVSLTEIVRAFKSFSAREINTLNGTAGQPVWQRNYFEHVIRHEQALLAIRAYIQFNPEHWESDTNHPDPSGEDPTARQAWLAMSLSSDPTIGDG